MKTELRDLLEEAGYDPERYAGRGSFGKACLGVRTADTTTIFIGNLMEALARRGGHPSQRIETNSKEAIDQFRTMRWDSMGRSSYVYYFPGIEID